MNELSTQARQLPDTLADLSRFVLVGREKLNAVRAEIRAIEKVQLAAEVHEQKLEEAQEIAEAVLDAETKLGELTSKMEQTKGARTDIKPTDSGVPKSKAQQLEEIGITEKQKQRFETLASHPEQVEKAKADARAEGKIVTRQDVFHKIASECYPNRIQKADRELREAKHRAEDYQADDGKIADFGKAKQHKEDNELIFNDFSEDIRKMYRATIQVAISLNSEVVKNSLQTISKDELKEVDERLSECYRTILKVQKNIVEVMNEK